MKTLTQTHVFRLIAVAVMFGLMVGLTACSDHDHDHETPATPESEPHDHSHDHDHHHDHDHANHEASAKPQAVDAADAAIIEAQLATYPLDTCVVAGAKLGSMGEPVNHVHEGRLVRFCCAGCLPGFNADPAKYLAKIDEALADDAHEHDH